MIGIIVNRYSSQRSHVEITEATTADGRVYLVNKREFEGGKVHLNTFDPRHFQQTSEMVIRGTLKRVEPQPPAA
jgi:hypothetical protein